MKKILPIFAANMAAYQEAASSVGFNKTTLAKRAGMSKGQWSDLLNGKTPNPQIWTAVRVADALKVSVSMLVTTDPQIRAGAKMGVRKMFARMAVDRAQALLPDEGRTP